jgi:hypothetical protein
MDQFISFILRLTSTRNRSIEQHLKIMGHASKIGRSMALYI